MDMAGDRRDQVAGPDQDQDRRKTVLWLTYGLPWPTDRGGSIRYFNLIRQVAARYRVLLFAMLESADEARHLPKLAPFCERVEWAVMRAGSEIERARDLLGHLLRGRPLVTWPYCSRSLETKLRDLVSTGTIHILQIEHSFLAPFRDAVPDGSPCRTILSFHNFGENQYRSMLRMHSGAVAKLGLFVKAVLMRGWEARLAARFDRCLVVSEIEAQRLRAVAADTAVSLVPNGVDTAALRPLPEAAAGKRLIFVGHLRYPPNIDAVRFLARHILPALRTRIPEARLTVVGEGAPRALREFAGRADIDLVGRASCPLPYYQDAHVAVVPLRAGGGTRLKILEAMALGRPVVSTPLGCEGLAVEDGKHLLIAHDVEGFAAAVARLLTDRPLAARLSREARALVERDYDWTSIADRLLGVYDDLLAL
jgi:glycosyltransferase involved in cell wall biosynthesis